VFLLGLITVLGFSDDNVAPIVVFSIFIAILIIYYYFYGYQTQKLSEEEHKILFKAYVINGKYFLD
jgi:L-asparagine transporter-like permease